MTNSELNMAEIIATMTATLMGATKGLCSLAAGYDTDKLKYIPCVHHTYEGFCETFKGEVWDADGNMFTVMRNGVKHFCLVKKETKDE